MFERVLNLSRVECSTLLFKVEQNSTQSKPFCNLGEPNLFSSFLVEGNLVLYRKAKVALLLSKRAVCSTPF